MEEARAVNRIEANLTHANLTHLAHSKVFLARKDAGKSRVENIYKIIFYLRENYSPHTEEQARIDDIPQDDRKSFSKSVVEVENMTLKNNVLLGGWVATAAKMFRRDKMRGKNLPNRFEEFEQIIYNYKNLYKLMIIAPKLFNRRVNMTYFVKNHDILLNYFREIEEQIPLKHSVNCVYQTCNSYFTEHTMSS